MPAKFIATIFGLKWIKKGCIIFENSQQHSEYQGRYTHEKIYHSSSRLTAQFLQFPVIANSTSRDELIIMDDILCQSGIEQEVIDFVLELEQTKNDERRRSKTNSQSLWDAESKPDIAIMPGHYSGPPCFVKRPEKAFVYVAG